MPLEASSVHPPNLHHRVKLSATCEFCHVDLQASCGGGQEIETPSWHEEAVDSFLDGMQAPPVTCKGVKSLLDVFHTWQRTGGRLNMHSSCAGYAQMRDRAFDRVIGSLGRTRESWNRQVRSY